MLIRDGLENAFSQRKIWFWLLLTGNIIAWTVSAIHVQDNEKDGSNTFDTTLKSQRAKLGSNYKMKCSIKSQGLTFWTINGTVPDGHKFKIVSDSNLVLKNVTIEDFSREYLCHAIIPGKPMVESMRIFLSPFEEEEKNAKSLGEPSDFLHRQNHKVNKVFAVVGTQKTLSCVAHARPHPEFKWLHRNGTIIKNNTDFTIASNNEDISNLTVFLRSLDYFDEYICEAWNPIGKSEQSFLLKLPDKPKEIPFIFPKSIGTNKITLGIKLQNPDNLTTHIEYRLNDSDEWGLTLGNTETAEISDLQPNTSYTIRAAAKNEFAFGNFSDPILVTTDKDHHHSVIQNGPKTDPRDRLTDIRSLELSYPDFLNNHLPTNNQKLIVSKSQSSKRISRVGNKLIISTNTSTIEEISDENSEK